MPINTNRRLNDSGYDGSDEEEHGEQNQQDKAQSKFGIFPFGVFVVGFHLTERVMKKIAPIKAPKQGSPKPKTKQVKPPAIASKDTLANTMRKVQKRAKPKAGKITL